MILYNQTTIYLFSEETIINSSELEFFCESFLNKNAFEVRRLKKQDMDSRTTIYSSFINDDFEFVVYDHGYVMKIEGKIRESIRLLKELDHLIDSRTIYFLSPTERLDISEERKYPRGSAELEIAQFLDKQFNNRDYTKACAMKI